MSDTSGRTKGKVVEIGGDELAKQLESYVRNIKGGRQRLAALDQYCRRLLDGRSALEIADETPPAKLDSI